MPSKATDRQLVTKSPCGARARRAADVSVTQLAIWGCLVPVFTFGGEVLLGQQVAWSLNQLGALARLSPAAAPADTTQPSPGRRRQHARTWSRVGRSDNDRPGGVR